jgi:hypothetical protein
MTTTDTFYTASGSSPPAIAAETATPSGASEAPPLPEELIEDLARLLAEAIVADIRQYPNLLELKAESEAIVESPWSNNRKRKALPSAERTCAPRNARRLAKAS